MAPKVVESTFSNVEEILRVAQEFLGKLEYLNVNNPVCDRIGDRQFMTKFLCYTPYCNQHAVSLWKQASLSQTQGEFRNLLQKAYRNSASRGISMARFLIKPQQRLCKYPFLIQEIIKYTNEASPVMVQLKEALERIEGIKTVAAELAVKRGPNFQKYTAIQSREQDRIKQFWAKNNTAYAKKVDAFFGSTEAGARQRRLPSGSCDLRTDCSFSSPPTYIVCPAQWEQGGKTIKPDPKDSKD
ncbi:Dbl homology domain-containing protein [Phlyctochytrium arcticum]|nr:Dbl homology domain-containing protein [Phlyctochytrium arcticum]